MRDFAEATMIVRQLGRPLASLIEKFPPESGIRREILLDAYAQLQLPPNPHLPSISTAAHHDAAERFAELWTVNCLRQTQ